MFEFSLFHIQRYTKANSAPAYHLCKLCKLYSTCCLLCAENRYKGVLLRGKHFGAGIIMSYDSIYKTLWCGYTCIYTDFWQHLVCFVSVFYRVNCSLFSYIDFITGESGTVGQFTAAAKWPYSRRINFRAPFQATPSLTYGLYFLDSSKSANIRVHASVTNVSRTGFKITMKSWADSVLYGGYVSWMACGK